ncbi:MAG TPA: HD domain-containing protein [Stellaceae bacterium]|nr:HD domain-containing protein [Stellaceae bacterium]
MTAADLVAEIETLFAARGGETYGEGVTIAEHCLQTAALAAAEGADDEFVIAALLHDIGHFIEKPDDRFGYHNHDRAGGAWLAARFPAEISEPVRLHVAAKRYLCTATPEYHGRLSLPSQHSLQQQGGPMAASEAAEFAALPFADRAIRLRRWDDRGKVAGIEVSPLPLYHARIRRLARR